MIDIAVRLKRYLGSSSQALLITLELAVIKKYEPLIIDELKDNLHDPSKLFQTVNRAYHKLSLKNKITKYGSDFPLVSISKYLIDAAVDADAISLFIQEFSIEKNSNDLYGFSTPVELKELMVSLINIKDYESVYNPCFGIGGFFGTIAKQSKAVTLFGEEIEEVYRRIGGLTAQLSGITECTLMKSDVILGPHYCKDETCTKFDKVICNPPLDMSFDIGSIKNDSRFKIYGLPPANASELLFLEHAIASMKEKAVVMVRLSVLQRSSNEAKIRTAIAYDGKIESVIALPKGIIPHWREDMALVILSQNNKDILFIDANRPYFSKRKGRRNTIYRVAEIVERSKNRTTDKYATLVPLSNVSAESLSPAYYFQKNRDRLNSKTLSSIAGSIFRSQRLQSNTNTDTFFYSEIGIKNIIINGYTVLSYIKKYGGSERIEIFKLQKLDILISLRGSAGTVGIVGEHKETLVCNSGLICIRLKNQTEAYALYLYLRSDRGQKALNALYDESPNRTINPEILATLAIPDIFDTKAKEKFKNLGNIQKEINNLEQNIYTIIN